MSAQGSLPRPRGPSTLQSSWEQNLHSVQAMSLSLTPFFSSLPSSQVPLPSSLASADSLGHPLIAVLSEKPRRASLCGDAIGGHLLRSFRCPHGLAPCLGSSTQLLVTSQGFLMNK